MPMQVTVRGVGCKVGDNLRSYAHDKVGHVSRLFDGLVSADVEFHEQRNPRVPERETVEVTMTTSAGTLIRAGAHSSDGFAAVDLVVGRLERQVRRLKDKLVGRAPPRGHPAGGVDFRGSDNDDEAGSSALVRAKRFYIKPLTH